MYAKQKDQLCYLIAPLNDKVLSCTKNIESMTDHIKVGDPRDCSGAGKCLSPEGHCCYHNLIGQGITHILTVMLVVTGTLPPGTSGKCRCNCIWWVVLDNDLK